MDLRLTEATDVSKIVTRLKNYYNNWHDHLRNVQKAYRLEYLDLRNTLKLPDGVDLHVPSSAPTIIDTLRDQVIVDNVTVESIPTGTSADAVKNAALLSRLGHGYIDRINDSLEVPLMRQMVFDKLLRGASCAKVLYDKDAVPVEPKRGDFARRADFLEALEKYHDEVAQAFCFDVRPIDPITVLPAPGRTHPLEYIFEIQKRHLSGIIADYPDWPDPKGKALRGSGYLDDAEDPTRPVEVTQVWTPKSYGIMADGAWAKEPGPNPYGFVPYVFSYSGLGRFDENADPESLGVTALSNNLSVLRAEVVARTVADALWQMHAFPPLVTKEDPRRWKEKNAGPGAIIQGDPENTKYLERPPPPQELYLHLAKLEQDIRNASGTDSLSGNRPKGVDYGYLQALMIGQARLRLNTIVTGVERDVARLLGMMLRLQKEVVKKPVRVWGVGGRAESNRIVKPDDIDNFVMKVHLDAVDPAENDRRIILGIHPVKAGLMSRRTYFRDYLKVADPEEEEAEIMKDQVIQQMVAQGILMPMAAQQMQQEQAQETLQSREKEALRSTGNRDVVRGIAPMPGPTGQPATPGLPQEQKLVPGGRGPLQSPVEGTSGGALNG